MYIFAYFRYVDDLVFKEKEDYKQLKMQREARVIIFSGRNIKIGC